MKSEKTIQAHDGNMKVHIVNTSKKRRSSYATVDKYCSLGMFFGSIPNKVMVHAFNAKDSIILTVNRDKEELFEITVPLEMIHDDKQDS